MKTNSASSAPSSNAAFTNMPFQALSRAQDGSISLATPPDTAAVISTSTPAPTAVVAPKVVRRPQAIIKRQSRTVFSKPAMLTVAAVTAVVAQPVTEEVKATVPTRSVVSATTPVTTPGTIWDKMTTSLNQRKNVFGLVKSVVEGNGRIYGVRVQLESNPSPEILGFAPFSRLGVTITEVHALLNTRQGFKVLEVNESKGSIVLNRRQAASQEKLDRLIGELHLGQVVTGVIRNTADCGAFVEIDGACGLIHVSKLPGGNIDSVKKGDQVTVKVIKLNKANHQLGLALA